MKTEWEVVVNQFKESFGKYKEKRILIYGTGKNTKSVLDHCLEEYNIIGLMDQTKDNEEIWGLHVFPIDELEKAKPDMIVIVARPSVNLIIYNRIKKKTEELNIPVYKLDGTKMSYSEEESNAESLFLENEELLKKEIEKYSVVSFDIFDTLLMRRTLYEEDVFHIMLSMLDESVKNNFIKNRKEAYLNLRREKYPSLDEIYHELNKTYNFNKRDLEKIKKLEIEVEDSLIISRKNMIDIANKCIEDNKTVILVSDMYLPAEIICGWLEKFGLERGYELFLSCEKRMDKGDGLFDYIADIYGADNILHIGDNEIKDRIIPAKIGINTFKIMAARDMLFSSKLKSLVPMADDLYKRNVLGTLISDVYNNPFILYGTNGKLRIDTEDILARLLAPIVLTYVRWTIGNIRKYKIDKVLFVARDGALPQKIYKKIKEKNKEKLPSSVYLYTSGRALAMANVDENTDFYTLYEEYRGTTERFVKDILGITIKDDDKDGNIATVIEKYKNEIIQSSLCEREEYKCYLQKYNLEESKSILYCDFFSKGTGQDNLEKLLGTKLVGNYLNKSISKFENRNKLKYETLFVADNHYEKDYGVFQNYSLLEYIISSDEPCLKCLKDGKPVFFEEDRGRGGIDFMLKIQKGVLDFCDELFSFSEIDYDVNNAEFEDMILKMIGESEWKCDSISRLATFEWFRGCEKIVEIV